MADYSNWKVPDLKSELKRRGIPQTGLRLKQQIIDRLLEEDAAAEAPSAPAEAAAAAATDEQPETAVAAAPAVEEGAKVEKGAEQPQTQPEPEVPVEQVTSREEAAPVAAPVEETQDSMPEVQSQDAKAYSAPEAAKTETEAEPPVQPPTRVAAEPDPASEKPVPPATPAEQRPEAQMVPMDQDGIPSGSSVPEPTPAVAPSETAPLPGDRAPSREESTEESRKRKRRSQSPPPSPRTAAQKKAKAEQGEPRVVLGDEAVGAKDVTTSEQRFPLPSDEVPVVSQDVDVAMSTAAPVDERPSSPRPADENESSKAVESTHPPEEPQEAAKSEKMDETHAAKRHTSGTLFKGLFPVTNGEQLRQQEAASHVEAEERVVEPSLHPATTSLYIRDFMRPLQPASLKMHLASLASPPGSSPDPDVITTFFLDTIKTHCLVTFSNLSAASRVRSALHRTIWPEERTRKPLWVDFVPEDKVSQWIDTEQNSGNGGRGAPRWEVVYEDSDSSGVSVTLQEAVPNRAPQGRGNRDAGMNAPTGPRAERDMQRGGPPPPPVRDEVPGHGFKALDDRFMSTTAKPKLYYLPVSRDISDKRLDRFDDLAKSGPHDRAGGDEMRKFTLEDTDFFVDRGPEFGRRGPRGGRGGGRGGGYGDFGRGWREASWRGRR